MSLCNCEHIVVFVGWEYVVQRAECNMRQALSLDEPPVAADTRLRVLDGRVPHCHYKQT